jgi:peptidoglycan hydrolase-like protein with peptidoglycan-binding domain
MKTVLNMFAVAAATGLLLAPGWAQERPSSKQSSGSSGYSGRVESGEDQNMPPPAGQFGTTGMSKEQIKKVEEALHAKGHNPGRVDGVIDSDTRAAIRAFQKDNNLSQTGTVDRETAAKLGVSFGQQSRERSGASSDNRSRSGSGYSGRVESGEDQNVPPGGDFKQSPR